MKTHARRRRNRAAKERREALRAGNGCTDLTCTLAHPHDASAAEPGPPGIVRPRMSRTRPARQVRS